MPKIDNPKWNMIETINSRLVLFASRISVGYLLFIGLLIRLMTLSYGAIHDLYISHIKYTDIDYHVFTNGSKAISIGASPYDDKEYRYTPLVALLFFPNVLIHSQSAKLGLILADIYCAQLLYRLNIYQGVTRQRSKFYLLVWLFNPINIAISTRGSFEPVLSAILLTSLYLLVNDRTVLSAMFFGLSVHLKLFPVIYSLPFYIYLIQRRPYLRNQSRLSYWCKAICPNTNHVKFYSSSALTFLLLSFICYSLYGYDYLHQSFIYHLKRKDLQHNFSIYFYLFRLLPDHQDLISYIASVIQLIAVISLSFLHSSIDANRRTKLRKLTFSLFGTTFVFVSLNKVCTSQYMVWYLVYLPLIMDSIDIDVTQAYYIAATSLLAKANWLFFAYLYEYQNYDILDYVGNSSFLLLACNIWIIRTLCTKFDANTKHHTKNVSME